VKVRTLILAVLLLIVPVTFALAAPYSNLKPGEASEMLQKRPDVYLLDVRTPQEYRDSRIDGATLIPIDNFLARQQEVPRDRPVLVYCAVGSRSSQVAGYLAQQGYPEVYNLWGGIWAWQMYGLPVLKGLP